MEPILSLEKRMKEVRTVGELKKFLRDYCKLKGMTLGLNMKSRQLGVLVKNSTVTKVLEFYCVVKREIIMKRLSLYSDKKELLNEEVLECLFHLTFDYLSGRDSCLMENMGKLEELAREL